MTHKDDLRLAFSGKEIASERIALIESTAFENETAEQFSRERREKYQRLAEQSEKKISEIKSRIVEDIGAKQLQLDECENGVTQIETQYQLGELSYEELEKKVNATRKKCNKVKDEMNELQHLFESSTSLGFGGRISIDIDKDVDESGTITKKPGLDLSKLSISNLLGRRF